MELIGFCIGFFLLGTLLGLLGTLLFIRGWDSRGRVDSGRKPFGKLEGQDPVVNTDREFIDGIRQERYEKGLDPYINES